MKTVLTKYLNLRLFAPEGGSGSGGDGGVPSGNTALTSGDPPPVDPAAQQAAGEQSAHAAAQEMYKEGEKPAAGDGEKPAEWKEYVADPNKSDEENAAAKAEHDKSKPDDKKDGEDKAKEGDEVKPEDYDLTPPEGFDVDPEVEKEFRSFAAENKLSKDVVGKLKDMQVKLYEKQAENHANTVAKWAEDLKAHKEIGGQKYEENIGIARAAIREFFPEDARIMLDKTGLGNHPDIAVGFVRMGRALGEGRTTTGNNSRRQSIASALYGDE